MLLSVLPGEDEVFSLHPSFVHNHGVLTNNVQAKTEN